MHHPRLLILVHIGGDSGPADSQLFVREYHTLTDLLEGIK